MKLLNHNDEQINASELITNQISVDFKFTAEELRKIENKFYQIFDLNPCPMAINDLTDYTIVDVNDAFLDVVKVKNKSDVIGKITTESGLNIIKTKDKAFVLNEIKEKGILKNYLCTVQSLDGKRFNGLFSGAIIELNGHKCFLTICQVVNKKCVFNIFKTLFLF